jgi:cell division protein FtsN
MAKDYKHRGQARRSPHHEPRNRRRVALWRWALITALIIAFVVFLVYLTQSTPKVINPEKGTATTEAGVAIDKTSSQNKPPLPEKNPEPKAPHFEFYNILPNKELIVPEHEIKTRTREERVGKAKDSQYIMQVGSFKAVKEAEQLRAKLALMGIQAKIDKAKVGSKTDKGTMNTTTWYRVKIGPYTKMTTVDMMKSRLKKKGIDTVVTEVGE